MGFTPTLEIKKFSFADSVRSTKKRLPGYCLSLKNWALNLADGLRIRFGYGTYTLVGAPPGAQILKVGSIQNPSQEDVHVWFADDGGQKVYVNPYWRGATPIAENMWVDEAVNLGTNLTNAFPTIHQIKMDSSAGLITTVDYYKNWIIYDLTHLALVTAFDGIDTFTVVEDISASGQNWAVDASVRLFRNFHDNGAFRATYNNDLTSPPYVSANNSVLRVNGGQSPNIGNQPFIFFPYIKRKYATGKTGEYAFEGSYISERRLYGVDIKSGIASHSGKIAALQTVTDALPDNRTYWFAASAIYDATQEGELFTYEDVTTYLQTDAPSNQNFVAAGAKVSMSPNISFALAPLNKRITGFALYIAEDVGDTRLSGRAAPYQFYHYLPVTDDTSAVWEKVSPEELYVPDAEKVKCFGSTPRSLTYETSSGIVEVPKDTTYAASTEEVIGGLHYLTNAYVRSESAYEHQRVFTNPIGGNPAFNSGIVAADMFSNEEGVYRLDVKQGVGTKINGIVPVNQDEMLVLKDRGVILNRVAISPDGVPIFIPNEISHTQGLATPNAWVRGHNGEIYFAGYDDIYAYANGSVQTLIERPDENDWLYNYRTMTKAAREACVIYFLPQEVVYFDFGTSGQWAFYPGRGWTEVALKQSSGLGSSEYFKWMTALQGGTVIGVAVDSSGLNPALRQWADPTTGALVFKDAGTVIKPYLDTGDLVIGGTESQEFHMERVVVNRLYDLITQGTLDCRIIKDGAILKTYVDLDKSVGRTALNSLSSDPKIGSRWRFIYNVNQSTPEGLNDIGTQFQIDSLEYFGQLQMRHKRPTEATNLTSSGHDMGNTIKGLHDIIVNTTPAWYTWDQAFTKMTTDILSQSVPAYKFEMYYRQKNDDPSGDIVVTVTGKTLTQIQLQAADDNTHVFFEAYE